MNPNGNELALWAMVLVMWLTTVLMIPQPKEIKAAVIEAKCEVGR